MAFVRDKQQQAPTTNGGGGFSRDTSMLTEFEQQPYWSQVRQRGLDMARAGISGVSLGLADKAAAGVDTLANGMTWDEAVAKQQKLKDEASARLDAGAPPAGRGAYAAIDFGGSLLNPLGRLSKLALPAEAGNVTRGLAYGTEGAAAGAASAWGHDQDPLTGAAVGGGAGVAVPWAAAAAPYLAKSLPLSLGGVGAAYFGWPGAWAGSKLGEVASPVIKSAANQIADKSVSTATGRDLLAELASAPGRLYGWATGK